MSEKPSKTAAGGEERQPSPAASRSERPLQHRQRLAVPAQPAGEPATRFANMSLGLYATMCNIVGLVFTLTGAFMSDRLGVAGWILTVFGVAVLFWSFMVTLYANRRVARRAEVERIVKINAGIIIAAVVALAVPGAMSSDGRVVFGGLTLATFGFTIAQLVASRTLT